MKMNWKGHGSKHYEFGFLRWADSAPRKLGNLGTVLYTNQTLEDRALTRNTNIDFSGFTNYEIFSKRKIKDETFNVQILGVAIHDSGRAFYVK